MIILTCNFESRPDRSFSLLPAQRLKIFQKGKGVTKGRSRARDPGAWAKSGSKVLPSQNLDSLFSSEKFRMTTVENSLKSISSNY